ncbi:hypothetical protein H0H92_010802 [Tricholoma furcatifolium]|nr:hypothetical protein H0H92_010802 [Tricholoma furcatifolium]
MSTSTSPKLTKQLKKEIAQEDKDEKARLDEAVKDINLTTKEQQKAHKAALKADSNVSKMEKKESVATAAVHKAAQEHDVAASHLQEAQKDAELKRQEDMRLQRALDEKKSMLDAAKEQQRNHKLGRESRLQDLEAGRRPEEVGPGMASTTGQGPTGVTGNVPGQYGTGTQGPTTGGGYTGQRTTEAVAAGAGLAGGTGVAARGTDPRDSAGMASSTVPVPIQQGQVPLEGHRTDAGVGRLNRTGDTGLSTGPTSDAQAYARTGPGTYSGERGIDQTRGGYTQVGAGTSPYNGEHISRDNKAIESGAIQGQPSTVGAGSYAGDRNMRGPGTGYGQEGIDRSRAPGTAPGSAPGSNMCIGDQGVRGDTGPISGGERYSAMPSATTGTGYGGGGGENLGIRGDSMMGRSGTGADPGIRTGGSREVAGAPEFVGQRNIGMGAGPETGYGAGQPSGQPIHRSTGIGGRQVISEEQQYNRDRMVMGGSGGQIGQGMHPSDSGVRGAMSGSGQGSGFGQGNMPGGYNTSGGYSTSAGASARESDMGRMSAT